MFTIAILLALLSPITTHADSLPPFVETIEKYAEQYGQNPYVALDIVNCESQFNSTAQSPTSDVGYFQINKIHISEMKAMGLDINDPDDNIHFAFYLMSIHPDLRDWNSSKACWSSHPISGGPQNP